MKYRLATSLVKLRDQINVLAPRRSTASDGWIGDASHFAQGDASDHNPWIVLDGMGVVTAIDITHDPANGCDVMVIAKAIAASRDPRLKYFIYTGGVGGQPGILSATVSPWTWRTRAADDHPHHLHISVNGNHNSAAAWSITAKTVPPMKPAPKPAPSAAKVVAGLRIDGDLGPATISALQKILKVLVTGKISEPSSTTVALQKFLNGRLPGTDLKVDGRGFVQSNVARTKTNGALQSYLGSPADGTLSSPDSLVVRKLQARLNTGRL